MNDAQNSNQNSNQNSTQETSQVIDRNPVIGMTVMLQSDETGWELIGLLPEWNAPSGKPTHRCVREDERSSIHQWQGLQLRLRPDQGDDYIYNLSSRNPMLFVICTTGEDNRLIPLRVSADQDDSVAAVEHDEQVFQVPMPRPIQAWVNEYVQTHWTPGPRKNKRRPGTSGEKDIEGKSAQS